MAVDPEPSTPVVEIVRGSVALGAGLGDVGALLGRPERREIAGLGRHGERAPGSLWQHRAQPR